ncbi:chromosome segregation protein SMC [Cyanobacterium stanieri LEGE 03274]|uniref:Chromosome partition protein Smc n=1 Tax=Cyanobacterium stanieri LEGE 03274 TaxID=1828756 RepID=A0ABR9V0J8_9CHRO|nr:chromosome segregation protein SMC [Cyanobacterium stanieri]MBE9221408.1 chromosome segregation protein SMC [Cyanobacterium stanieri LEGE 03274]
MVYVKRVELSRFKSFGGSNAVPFLPGFTVISGPNGSGKSNILDALLFCLGLASSKGMRADRLPDLINNSHKGNNKTLETIVSVTFDLSDFEDLDNFEQDNSDNNEEEKDNNIDLKSLTELKITRRLRVTKKGSYASTFYVNDQPCTATELQTQLNRLRIYPEGYNVVLQGDVTRIITMNAKQRREIIDELAGVAEFDRKINQTKSTLEAVKEREEKCHIITQELSAYGEKLQQDSQKAAKYQKLKAKIQEKKEWAIVINWRYLQEQEKQFNQQIINIENDQENKQKELTFIREQSAIALNRLEELNQEVKALGEEEQISIASKLATQKAKKQQLKQRQKELEKQFQNNFNNQEKITTNQQELEQQLVNINKQKEDLEKKEIPTQETKKNELKKNLETLKQSAQEIAAQSQAWVEQQTALNQEINQIQNQLNPQLTQKALLQARSQQLQTTIKNQNQQLTHIETQLHNQPHANFEQDIQTLEKTVQKLAQQLSNLEQEITLNQETVNRLLIEQRDKQRQLDKLEATKQAQQEAQGTYASKIILNSDLPGVCGLVAQLGQVETVYQLALEICAGGRLGFIVVEDDSIAAAGIKLLKEKKAGRATFLPLNKIKAPRLHQLGGIQYAQGYIDLAVNLITCEDKYRPIFAYVFGNTMVFSDLESARNFIGQERIVTLDGELLEASGAMTGGSISKRNALHFGNAIHTDSAEVDMLYKRIQEIEDIIIQLNLKITEKRQQIKTLSEELSQARQNRQKKQLDSEQWQKENSRLETEKEKIITDNGQNYQQLVESTQELTNLEKTIPILEAKLTKKQTQLKQLESSYDNQEWQNLQSQIQTQELELEEQQKIINQTQNKLQSLVNQSLDIALKSQQNQDKLDSIIQSQDKLIIEQKHNQQKLIELGQEITNYESQFQALAQKLADIKKARDDQEKALKKLENQQQQLSWNLEKLLLQHQETQTKLTELKTQLAEITPDLPNPLPDIPYLINKEGEDSKIVFDNLQEQLEQINKEIRNGEKRLEALEPVNMLALEEYEKNQERLKELSDKLATLEGERTELLLRVENFTTLRLRAFKEAFTAVNENFKTIFATLSEGDGYLKLEDENNPFNGGLTLVAHPKGKPVTRLSSMSGGEKSLTALSFIFALQRYRPSPFYAFDEVDMFLDGANVEKLSKMIQQQAKLAQFIVVSLRRPMIEASERTIGVTQARGAYTQVLGIKL